MQRSNNDSNSITVCDVEEDEIDVKDYDVKDKDTNHLGKAAARTQLFVASSNQSPAHSIRNWHSRSREPVCYGYRGAASTMGCGWNKYQHLL